MITLQQSFNFSGMGEGTAIIVIGILFLLLAGAVQFRNAAAGVAWGLTVLLFVLSHLLELGTEVFWIGVITTSVILIVGLIARWSL